jgi:hypothetical protein
MGANDSEGKQQKLITASIRDIVVGALIFVAALSWRDVFKTSFENIPIEFIRQPYVRTLVYALVVTALSVGTIVIYDKVAT